MCYDSLGLEMRERETERIGKAEFKNRARQPMSQSLAPFSKSAFLELHVNLPETHPFPPVLSHSDGSRD